MLDCATTLGIIKEIWKYKEGRGGINTIYSGRLSVHECDFYVFLPCNKMFPEMLFTLFFYRSIDIKNEFERCGASAVSPPCGESTCR